MSDPTPTPETPDAQLVLILTHRQAALAAISMTAGMLSGLVPVQNIPDAAEIIGMINEAIGNPSDPAFNEVIEKLRQQVSENE